MVTDWLLYLLLMPLAYLWGFWLLYVLVMGLYRAYLAKRIGRVTVVLSFPVVLVGYVLDAATNCTLAWAVFIDPPREILVTSRLKRYIKDGSPGWRTELARWVCSHLLDPFDPNGTHCG